MSHAATFETVSTPATWRGDDGIDAGRYTYVFTAAELDELERVAGRLLGDEPDLATMAREDYPLPACAAAIAQWVDALDRGFGFVVARGLRVGELPAEMSGAIFLLLGMHLGAPMRQNVAGDLLTHVVATSTKDPYDPTVLSSHTTGALSFHSDSSDVVGLLCLHAAASGGASLLASGATLYNEVLRRRPDLVPALFEPVHWDWWQQDFDAPTATYESPMCCIVDGVLSVYGGSKMVFTAQDSYPEVPRLTTQQREALELVDAIAAEPGVALAIDFEPGDIQWLSNYAAMHSRTAYADHPEPERRRHLIRMWLRRDERPPIARAFGKPVEARGGPMARGSIPALMATPAPEPDVAR
jgi:TfdA family taurine catabolism dioxygenase TauD